ncbi:hypothetical protein SCP_1001120 [Sparassis crispa]|uniref:Glycoside hydrolase family 2 catalytic domain-containing protein n=1 Tax=Sparassis crispa TaxID=139825 RepID=A0A401GXG2_9APHY|nr:hypothetical protein SCP_1001120 [Sparassis crispa]GBE86870.1 hypothetical protein SCP_1001120 [Sparassis crispa]
MSRLALAALLSIGFYGVSFAQTWCGKNYMASQPIVPPGGQFTIPAISSTPVLAFRCAPAIKPYLPEDVATPAGILIDTYLTYSQIEGAVPITLSEYTGPGELAVTVSLEGRVLTTGVVPLNATKVELPFSLLGLEPQMASFDVSCEASYSTPGAAVQTFSASTAISYLPTPPDGRSATKMDLRTGALLAKPASGAEGPYETVLPTGFYTGFGGYLATNLSIIDEVKSLGYTVIHPIPPYDNITQLFEVIERMEQVGLHLMYDMRLTYMNTTAVTEEVNRVKNSPALLLWYTGDEPDGTSDPLNATSIAYDLIYELDGYHPVSLVLNCQDYYWPDYTAGTDIVMQDTYMIGNNVTWSLEWNTACTPVYGCCGCDNCKGNFEDISTRMDEFAYRLWVEGWEGTKSVWTVPQGFGGEEYWTRPPTGQEFVVQSALGINHGALGVVSWDMPTTADILSYGSLLAQSSTALKDYIANDRATFQHAFVDQIDVGLWTVGEQTLVLATNLNYAPATFDLMSMPGLKTVPAVQVLNTGATLNGTDIVLDPVGTGAFILG